ncbi:pilus assembly protein Flp/PilA [Peptoclostridium litorale DSM 5388]|uniref:Flp family type IVb pilin n=1 Tax=Peptoclostridium litorale DSM 5388 TaxID=1121324 RepID=A0A069RAE2_PEPLI|nr:Flp family type IVb pilin [Peptoclostridium litorale]KDR93773.1 hypothetical protein CLIT_23c00450 [Peptoclostridium litorale DSM 5388]SIN85581.1 pilus assembly protein Flp/PilA [Peptoclostridium litorale DSM 5388]
MLRTLMNYFGYYVNDERGQGLVEYALIIVLIAIVVIAALTLTGTSVSAIFESIADSLGL